MFHPFPKRHILLLIAILTSSTFGDADETTSAGVFVFPSDAGNDFSFALNAVDNGDLYFHMSGPTKCSWIAVGIGEDMDDNLMFVLYQDSDGDSVTLSPRVAFDGTSEPSYYPSVRCEQFGKNADKRKGDPSDERLSVDAVCHNATTWEGGSLDLGSASQAFMFAFGPDGPMRSDSLSAPMLRHQLYGNFAMDMTKASSSGTGALPGANGSGGVYVAANTSDAENVTSDSDNMSIIHGVVICVAYIILFPLGALLLRLAKRIPVRLHWICQSLASALVLIGSGLGIAASMQYNRSRDFTSSHQIIGIVLLVAVAAQLALGTVHHRIFKRKSRSSALGRIHLVVGPFIILLAIVNGGLGLDLALASMRGVVAYAVAVGVLASAVAGVRTWIHFRGIRNEEGEGFQAHDDDIPLQH